MSGSPRKTISKWPTIRAPRPTSTATTAFTSHEDQEMAKGQQRSNRETRKPKKDKAAAKPATPFGSAVKQAEAGLKPKSKG
jgi:hypothetical protein